MLQYSLKRFANPIRAFGRRFVLLPTLEEQEYLTYRGCIRTAATFVTRNYVAGDYLEFGCWKGDSFIRAYHYLNEMRRQHTNWLTRHTTHSSQYGKETSDFGTWKDWQTRFFAFDSFEGLPASAQGDLHEGWAEGSYACSEEQFKKNIASEGVNLKDVTTVKGFYDKTLTPDAKARLGLRRAAIVNIDCDLYESTIVVLDFITDLVRQGTILVFDDWFCYQGRPDCGEQQACREWLARNPQLELIEYWREPPQPMSFIVNFKK